MIKKFEKNGNKLKTIVDPVILLGSLGLPRDHSRCHPNVKEYLKDDVSNLIASLNYSVRDGDTVLEKVSARSTIDVTRPVTEILQGKQIQTADALHLHDSLKSAILSKLYCK